MRRRFRIIPIVFSAFVLAVFLLPQYVSAAGSGEVLQTEEVRIDPYNGSADEIINVANDTSRFNRDTWTNIPSGIFVGGTIPESLMRAYDMLLQPGFASLATVFQFQENYVGSGAAEFTVRLPWSITPDWINADSGVGVSLQIWELPNPSDYRILAAVGDPVDLAEIATNGGRCIMDRDNLANVIDTTYTTPLTDAWLDEDRLYMRLWAPLVSMEYYLFFTSIYLNSASYVDFYVNPSDVASDGLTHSEGLLYYRTTPTEYWRKSVNVNADAGWSFVFQESIGDQAVSVDNYYYSGDYLYLTKWTQSPTLWLNGSLNFIFEFVTNVSLPLVCALNVEHHGLGGYTTALSDAYWTGLTRSSYLIASNPVNVSYMGMPLSDGTFWHKWSVRITFQADTRMEMLTYADPYADTSGAPGVTWDHSSGTPQQYQDYYFSPWLTCSVDQSTWNFTYLPPGITDQGSNIHRSHKSFFLAEWIDNFGTWLYNTGTKLAESPFPPIAMFGRGLMVAGIVNWVFSDLLQMGYDLGQYVIQTALDGLSAVGHWLWNVAVGIYKALVWLADQILNFGSQLIALVIYALAVIMPVLIITMATRLFSMFYRIAKGDLEGAASEGRAIVATAAGVTRVVTGGKVG